MGDNYSYVYIYHNNVRVKVSDDDYNTASLRYYHIRACVILTPFY